MLFVSFVLYLLILITVSKLLSQRMTGLTDFFLAGRKLPGIAIALAYVSSWFGAGSTMGSMNEAFTKGISAVWLIAVPSILSILFVVLFLAKKVRQLEIMTQPEAVESRYGPAGALMLAWIILASITAFIASQLFAAGQLLHMAMGLSPGVSIVFILSAIVIYSVIGGFRAVVMTDILQFISYTLGLLILLGYILIQPAAPMANPGVLLNADFWNPWLNLPQQLAMTFTFVLAWSIAPEMWQRMASTRNPKSAQKAALVAMFVLIGLYVVVIATGILAVSHIVQPSDALKDNVLIALAMNLPPVLSVLVLLGVLSAICSTIDSSLNVGSMTFSRDIIQRHIWQKATENQLVWVSRIMTVLLGIPAAVIALHYQSIIQILWVSADIYASTMFVPIIGLFYVKNSGRWSGILAMALGAIPVVLTFLKDFAHLSLPGWWPVWPYTTILGVGLSVFGFALGYAIHRYSESPEPEHWPIKALTAPEP